MKTWLTGLVLGITMLSACVAADTGNVSNRCSGETRIGGYGSAAFEGVEYQCLEQVEHVGIVINKIPGELTSYLATALSEGVSYHDSVISHPKVETIYVGGKFLNAERTLGSHFDTWAMRYTGALERTEIIRGELMSGEMKAEDFFRRVTEEAEKLSYSYVFYAIINYEESQRKS